MDVLCTDKTGTLTQGKIVLEKHLDVHGEPSEKVLQYGYLNSFHHTGLKNLLDNFSQTTIPTDQVDADWLTKPRQWGIGKILRFILFIGPISSIFDYPTFFLTRRSRNQEIGANLAAWKRPMTPRLPSRFH